MTAPKNVQDMLERSRALEQASTYAKSLKMVRERVCVREAKSLRTCSARGER